MQIIADVRSVRLIGAETFRVRANKRVRYIRENDQHIEITGAFIYLHTHTQKIASFLFIFQNEILQKKNNPRNFRIW